MHAQGEVAHFSPEYLPSQDFKSGSLCSGISGSLWCGIVAHFGAEFPACPLGYLEKLFLLNYSLNTIRTYHGLLLRFLNGHCSKGLEGINALTEQDINEYHRAMVQGSTYSCSLINQSINTVKFYY